MRYYSLALLIGCLLLLSACASNEKKYTKQLTSLHQSASTVVSNLEKHLKLGRVRNALILEAYAKKVREKKPDLANIVDVLARDASSSGPIYQSLVERLDEAKKAITQAAKSDAATADLADEIYSISTAASPSNYNMMLTDPINVLADMSQGELARVEALSKEASAQLNKAGELGTGAQLVGNPHYGQWQTHSSGQSFWAWYGQYAFFSSLFSRPISYGYWSNNRDYSYYHDRGRSYYSSPRQKAQSVKTQARVKKHFSKQGKTFNSPYAKSRHPSKTAAKKFGSKYADRSVKTPNKFGGSKYASKNASGSKKSSKPFNSSYNSRSSSSSRSFGFGGK